MLIEELKNKDCIIKYVLQTITETKTKSISAQPIPSGMSSSEAETSSETYYQQIIQLLSKMFITAMMK